MKKLYYLRYALLMIIIGVAIARLAPEVQNIPKIIALKDSVRLGFVFLAFLSQIFQYVGDAWLSILILRIIKVKVTIKKAFLIASLNVFAAHLLPVGEAGGVALAYHFYKKLGVTTSQYVFLTLCWGVFTNAILLLLFFIPLFTFHSLLDITRPSLRTDIIISSIVVLFISAFIFRQQIWRKILPNIEKVVWGQHLLTFMEDFPTYRKLFLSRPDIILFAVLAACIYYGANIATLTFAFMAFHIMPPILLVEFAFATSLIFGRITLAPAGIGAAEASLILIFTGYGMPAIETLGAVFIYRFLSFWIPIPAGATSFFILNHMRNQENKTA